VSSDCSIICGLPDPPWEAAGRDLPPAPQARVDGPDQGERGDRGVSRTVFVGLAHARTRNGRAAKVLISCTCISPNKPASAGPTVTAPMTRPSRSIGTARIARNPGSCRTKVSPDSRRTRREKSRGPGR
jgi:hypothetical protein